LRDRPNVIAGRLLRTAHIAGTTYVESGCGQRAAAISYHVIFSLVPFLAVLLTVLELVLPDSAHDRVVEWLVTAIPLPIDVSTSVEGAIRQAGTPASVAGAIALIGFVWAASGMMGALRLAFRAVWGNEPNRPYLRGKLLDGALVLGAGLLILTAFGLTIVVQVATATGTKIAADFGLGEHATGGIGSLAQLGASLALGFAAFALLYRVVPPVPVRLADVLPGAAFATIGVYVAGAGFSIYLDRFADFDDIYGPLGAVLAFLLLVWLTAAILLVGACVAAAWPVAAQPVLVEAEGPLTARLVRAAKGLIVRDRT
jgi:membrane protein